MPTDNGSETIGEALQRLRIDLSRVEETISRAETNGQTWGGNSHHVTEIAYERALSRRRDLQSQIRSYEARLKGKKPRKGMAKIKHS